MWWFLKKLNTEPPFELVIPLLAIYPEELKAVAQTDVCTSVFMEALYRQSWEQPKCLSSR